MGVLERFCVKESFRICRLPLKAEAADDRGRRGAKVVAQESKKRSEDTIVLKPNTQTPRENFYHPT